MKIEPNIKFLKQNSLFFGLIIILFSSCITKVNAPENENVFNLKNQIFDNKTVYNLDGNWEFYWDTLLTPAQIKTTDLTPEKVDVPSLWSKYEINGKNLPQTGYATYHTKIIVPEKGFYSIKLKRIFLSCNVFINDTLISSIGKVATNKKDYVSSRMTKELIFYSASDTIDLVIQVANFSHKKAGITRPVKFGTQDAIIKYTYTNLLYDMLAIGAMAFMMFFYFVLYFYNKEIRSNLDFAIFLLVEIITIALDRELIFFRVFPDFNWNIASKIYYIATYFRALMFVILISNFTKGYFSPFVKKLSIAVTGIMSVFILFTPMIIYSKTLIIMVIFTLSTLFYELFATGKALKSDKNLYFAFIGLLVIIISGINDALFEYGIVKTFYSSSLGIIIFTLLQAGLLSIKNAELIITEKNLNNRIEIEKRLKENLLTTPSYKLHDALLTIAKNTGVEKIIIFSRQDDDFFAFLYLENSQINELNKKFEITETKLYNGELVGQAIAEKKDIIIKNQRKSDNYKNIIILPIIQENKIVTVFYFENKNNHLHNAQVEVLASLKLQFNSLINSALTYYRLQEANKVLEQKVKSRTELVEQQKKELDLKNQQLDEKIQLLEEQYTIQNEINEQLQNQLEERHQQSLKLKEQNEKLQEQIETIEKHNRLINENIEYANNILNIISPEDNNIPFKEYFHFDLPRDIVSGDFLYLKNFEHLTVIALADCTGHGVPGALMHAFAIRKLEKILTQEYANNKTIQPDIVLNKLRDNIKNNMSSDKEKEDLKDGLDIALCIYDNKSKKLWFSGAYQSAYIIRNDEILTLKGDRMPIGSYIEGFEFPFNKTEIEIIPDDILYLSTDGYFDQFNENNQKFYKANFKKLIFSIKNKTLDEQKEIIKETFLSWKGNYKQLDDVSVFAAKFI